MEPGLALFWSYAHADNLSDRGRILALAEHVRAEFALVTGDDVALFVDQDGLRWGDDWRAKIEDALNASTFFIPILTPRYFQRPECRRELTDFYGQAESRGLSKLIMPLLYTKVAGLEESSTDPLLALSARTQYFDWTSLRLADSESERYRTAVGQLVEALVERWAEMRAVEDQISVAAAALHDPGEWGLAEALQEIDRRLPIWLDLLEDDPVVRAQYGAIRNTYDSRMRRSRPQQRLGIEHKMVSDLLPLDYREAEGAKAYSALTIEMHPFVLAALRAAHDAPEAQLALEALIEAIGIAKQAIDRNTALHPGQVWSHDHWQKRRHLGAMFREIADLELEIKQYKEEGNRLVQSWVSELAGLGLFKVT